VLAERECNAFATDVITCEKKANALPPFEPLWVRMEKHRSQTRRGLHVVNYTCGLVCARAWHRCLEVPAVMALLRWCERHNPFKLMFITIGAHLGSSTASYLDTSQKLVFLNFVLFLVWIPLVIGPQIAFSDCARDLEHDFRYMFASQVSASLDAGSGTTSAWEGEPSLWFFGGYKPRYYPTNEDGSYDLTTTAWPMDACYVTTIFATFCLSLIYLVKQIGAKMASADRLESLAVKKASTFLLVENTLGGFDFAFHQQNSSNRERRRMTTSIKEALHDQARARDGMSSSSFGSASDGRNRGVGVGSALGLGRGGVHHSGIA